MHANELSNSLQQFIIAKNQDEITHDANTKVENTGESPSSNFVTMDIRENPTLKKFNIESIMKVNPSLNTRNIDDGRTSHLRSILLESPDQIRTIQLPED